MIRTVNAKYANGVLTPLEPLDLEDGSEVVLNIDLGPNRDRGNSKSKFRIVPFSREFAPGVDPRNLKQFLNDEDDELYLRSLNKTK